MPFARPEAQLEVLSRGVVDLVSEKDLLARLAESRHTGVPLKIKAGFDPTRPDLHLGHTVLMEKMRQFQELGHEIYFVIGDFTASIGDPSGKNKTRPPLTREEIDEGARTYAEQAFKILDRSRTKLVYNGSWLGPMSFADVIKLAGKYTLARMMERQDFKKRFEEGSSISMHELLYPLVQAYDSVHLVADVELGGTDQLFNLMVGRDLMKEWGLRPQIVMTTPLLEGLTADADASGKIVGDKMSKSLDNYVGVSEPAEEQLGKLMSISDPLMWRYYELLSKESRAEIDARRAGHPKEAKRLFAMEIVTRFHDAAAAERVWAAWEKQFSRREIPDAIPEHTLATAGEGIGLAQALAQSGLSESNSKARALIEQGGVEVDSHKVKDKLHKLAPGTYVIKAGKRSWGRLVVT
ncbi:MAG: tyrosine--tRNA ligase [Deltaproteobacteria bacterium]|jgi:tyrosyl-tRNA synthetase